MDNININSISLSLNREWELKDSNESIKIWHNKLGDKISLNFFAKNPDLPEKITDISSLRSLYREMVTKANGAIVEIDREYINNLFTIKAIFKYSQKSTGFVYLTSYTIPRKRLSIVLKVQCHERGITGMRESVVLDKSIGNGLVDSETMKGWFFDPYDPSFKAPLLSNIADKEEYDDLFPNHPLTRARKYLKLIKENVEFSDVISKTSKFFLNFD